MGHRDKLARLNKTKPHRESMLDNMTASLLRHRQIQTTDAKAKALRSVMDRFITIAKQNTLESKRRVMATLRDHALYYDFYKDILPQLGERTSGYTRVMKLGVRRGDNAPLSVIELLIPRPVAVEPVAGDKKAAKSAGPAKSPAKSAAKSSAPAGKTNRKKGGTAKSTGSSRSTKVARTPSKKTSVSKKSG
jgi:large subunit ribosomal protein L17